MAGARGGHGARGHVFHYVTAAVGAAAAARLLLAALGGGRRGPGRRNDGPDQGTTDGGRGGAVSGAACQAGVRSRQRLLAYVTAAGRAGHRLAGAAPAPKAFGAA